MLKVVEKRQNLFQHIIHLIKTSLISSVPGLIYFIQNMLLYIILQNTQAAVYTVIIQLKIFTTAVFSILFLGRKLSFTQWRALILLVCGVILVEISANRNSGKNDETENNLLGILLSLLMTVCSGFSGVYMEKILKNKTAGAEPLNIWERNVQLSVYGTSFALISTFVFDGQKVLTNGFFGGWSYITILLIIIQGVGGIIVALVMTYADNIVKGFSIGSAIVLTTICSIFIFGAQVDMTFAIGASFVIISIANYNDKYAKPDN